ncbi:MAG: hypothetical protein EP305_05505 [Bacteroidetes bacterium]|nr:MAG: hypothetical protein EP305_05505 [Bacteroidota bacterium]
MDLFIIIYESITHLILWTCAGFLLYRFNRLDRSFKILAIYSIIQPMFVTVSTYLAFNGMNNHLIRHILTHLEFMFMIAAFYSYFKEKIIFNVSLMIMSFIYVVFSIFDTLYLEPVSISPANINLVANVIFILCALGVFYDLYEKPTVVFLEKEVYFWMGASFLTYFGATIFISLFFNYIAFELPLWVYDFFASLDLLIFAIAKLFLLYGAYLLARNRSSHLILNVK